MLQFTVGRGDRTMLGIAMSALRLALQIVRQFLSSSVVARAPQIERGVRPPRPPFLCALFHSPRVAHAQGPEQSNVTGRKGVRLAERAHRDILRGPWADAGKRGEAAQEGFGVRYRIEVEFAATDRARKALDAFGPLRGQS